MNEPAKAALLFIFVIAISGCKQYSRTVQDNTGRIKAMRVGMLTQGDGTNTAYVIIQTTIGTYAFAQDDLRGPKQIIADWNTLTDRIARRQFSPGTTVDLTLRVIYWTRDDWTRDTTPGQEVHFHFNPDYGNPELIYMVRAISRDAPKEHFTESFQRDLDIPFRYWELESRSLGETTHGP